jgi:hypothetical protein
LDQLLGAEMKSFYLLVIIGELGLIIRLLGLML